MAVILDNGVLPASKDCAAEVIYEGKVYKYNGDGRMTVATTGSTAYAVAICSSFEVDGDAKTMAAGEGHPFAMMGSNMLVHCYSVSGTTYSGGNKVYLSTATDGAVNSTGTVIIGTYEGKNGLVTTTLGDLVAVRLDRAPAADT